MKMWCFRFVPQGFTSRLEGLMKWFLVSGLLDTSGVLTRSVLTLSMSLLNPGVHAVWFRRFPFSDPSNSTKPCLLARRHPSIVVPRFCASIRNAIWTS